MNILVKQKQQLQEEEYFIPYHYQDLFAPGQGVEKIAIYDTVLKYLELSHNSVILDVGCGDGRFCYHAKNYCQVEGIDYSERAITWAKAFNPELIFYSEDFMKKKFHKLYDGIVALQVLEHIPDNEIYSFLFKINEILREGGRCIISVPSKILPLEKKHFRHYNKEELLIVLSPFFDVEIIGQSRTAKIHRKVMSILNILSLLFYSENFCDRFPKAVEYITKLKTNYWLKYLHLGKPESCRRLLAICKKNDQS